MHLERLEQQQLVIQQLGLSMAETAAADTAAGTSKPPLFLSEPGTTAAAAHAATAGATVGTAVTSKSDPGAAGWGFGSLAYRRTAAKTIYDRASIAAAQLAASAAQAGAGAGLLQAGSAASTPAAAGLLQSWDSQHPTPSAQQPSCMASPAGHAWPPCSSARSSTTQAAGSPWEVAPALHTPNTSSGMQPAAGGFERLSSNSYSSSSSPRSSLCDGSNGPRTPSSTGCKTPSKLGQAAPAGAVNSGPQYQAWLGHGPATAADDEQEAAAALAEQQYYGRLHAVAAEQARLHGELRDTFVLRAYKGKWVMRPKQLPCMCSFACHCICC